MEHPPENLRVRRRINSVRAPGTSYFHRVRRNPIQTSSHEPVSPRARLIVIVVHSIDMPHLKERVSRLIAVAPLHHMVFRARRLSTIVPFFRYTTTRAGVRYLPQKANLYE